MSTENNYPWMQNVKPSPTAEQAALIEDYRRVSIAASDALRSFAETNCGSYESEAWRETYDGLDAVAKAANLRWAKEAGQYTL